MKELSPKEIEEIENNWINRFSTGAFIRAFLRSQDRGYPYQMWELYKDLEGNGGSYQDFVRYVYICEELGLIKKAGRGEAKKGGSQIKPQYYELVPEYEDLDVVWNKPQGVLYPKSLIGGAQYEEMKEEAEKTEMSLEEIALEDNPELKEAREKLGFEERGE